MATINLSDTELMNITPAGIVIQIYIDLDLLDNMVGSLYPSMVLAEIATLRNVYRMKTGKECPA